MSALPSPSKSNATLPVGCGGVAGEALLLVAADLAAGVLKANTEVNEFEILSKKVETFAASNPAGNFRPSNNPEIFSPVNVFEIAELNFESNPPLFE